MDRKIMKKMNKDIDLYYINQKNKLKDNLNIERKPNHYFIPKLLLTISTCLCIYLYSSKQPILKNLTLPIYVMEYTIEEDTESKKESYQYPIIEENNDFTICVNQPQYIDIYILCSLNIMILCYIFYKKYQ